MAIKFSTTVKNAMLDAIETAVNTSAKLKIRSGAVPTNISDADSGTVLATLDLPSDWMQAASGGTKQKSVSAWEDLTPDNAGTAGHFRIYANDGTTQHIQGTVTQTGNGGDMELSNTSITTSASVTVTSFTFTAGN